jgi:tagaturonate reductase
VAFLYERYTFFNGDLNKGLLILPVELIDDNGAKLKEICLRYAKDWSLSEGFITWFKEAVKITSTLVDRIVTGHPFSEMEKYNQILHYEDPLLNTSELFNLWVIEGKKEWSDILPIHKTEANVLWTDDVKPYKKRKVRILNGSHTAVIPCAFIAGYEFVLDFINDPSFYSYEMDLIYKDILPILDLPEKEKLDFADSVVDRFKNPFIKHRLLDITLNNSSKFKARCVPTIVESYEKYGVVPKRFAFAIAGFLRLYKVQKIEGSYVGTRENGESYSLRDEENVISYFADLWSEKSLASLVHEALSNQELWGVDFTVFDQMESCVLEYLEAIESDGMKKALKKLY